MSLPENDKLSVDSGNVVKFLVGVARIDGQLVDLRRRVVMSASLLFRGLGCFVERDVYSRLSPFERLRAAALHGRFRRSGGEGLR
jgi:hypothetical protein